MKQTSEGVTIEVDGVTFPVTVTFNEDGSFGFELPPEVEDVPGVISGTIEVVEDEDGGYYLPLPMLRLKRQ